MSVASKRYGPSWLAAIVVLVASGGCGPQRLEPIALTSTRACDDGSIAWAWNTATHKRRTLDAWCESVGPPLLQSAAHVPDQEISLLRVVTWNVHVGGGQLSALLTHLRGRDGNQRVGVVLLLQEVFRASADVPETLPVGGNLPDSIRPRSRTADIASLARAADLFLAYVPSMRNGSSVADREDRGSAILSSEPIRDVTAIELPFGKQRRVAVMATVAPRGRTLPSLRVVAGHLDTPSANLEQAESLAAFLQNEAAAGLPMVLGIDTNAAWGGADASVKTLETALPRERQCGRRPTATWFSRLDFFFTSLPRTVRRRCDTIADKFGSDHRPVVLSIELAERP